MDEKEMKGQDQRWKRIMNGRWKHGRSIRKSGMDGACPQCRVQVEKGKVNGWISGGGRKWIQDRKMKGGLKHLDIWMYPLIFFSFFFCIFKEFLLFSHRCW